MRAKVGRESKDMRAGCECLGTIMRRVGFRGQKRALKVALCNRRKWQGVVARGRRVRCARVAGCEVVVLHPAKFGNGRVRYSGVAPCDLFLIILSKSGGNAKVDANVLEVSFAVPWIGKPKHPIIAPRQLSWMECACKSVESQNWKRKKSEALRHRHEYGTIYAFYKKDIWNRNVKREVKDDDKTRFLCR